MELDSTSDVSTLYTAATESLVSDQAGNSTFEKMLRVAYTHAGVETLLKRSKRLNSKSKKTLRSVQCLDRGDQLSLWFSQRCD